MVSLVYSMADSLRGVKSVLYFFRGKKNRGYLDAILLIRPTERNIFYLKQYLQDPSYKSYKIYFTNSCPPHFLRQLAESDRLQRVQCVFEYYADYAPLGPELFISNFSQKSGGKKGKDVAISKAPTIDPSYNEFSNLYATRSAGRYRSCSAESSCQPHSSLREQKRSCSKSCTKSPAAYLEDE